MTGDRDTLTDDEREALDVASTQYVHGGHIVPDLHTVVERIVAARVRAAQAQAWEDAMQHATNWTGDPYCGEHYTHFTGCPNPYSDAGDEFQNPED